MKKKMLVGTAFIGLAALGSQASVVTDTIYAQYSGNTKGYWVKSSSVTANNDTASNWGASVGMRSGVAQDFVLAFLMPDEGSHFVFSSANFQCSFYRNQNSPNYHLDLYGLARTGTTIAAIVDDFYAGANDTANYLIQDSFINTSSTYNGTLSTNNAGDAALVGWLNSLYANGAAGKYIYIRYTIDTDTLSSGTSPNTGLYQVRTDSSPEGGIQLSFTGTTVPEPVSAAVLGVCGLSLLALRRRG